VEKARLEASEASMRYARANAALLRSQLAAMRERKANPALIETAEATLRTTESLATESEAAWKRMRYAFAETNLSRRRTLAAEGLISKSELRRAEVEFAKVREDAAAAGRPAKAE
jgi:multidrug resistance efflux pump